MKYSIGNYFSIGNDNSFRLEVVPDDDVEGQLINRYRNLGFEIIDIWSLFNLTDGSILLPDVILKKISQLSLNYSNQIVIRGIDIYLKLLSDLYQKQFFNLVRTHLEHQDLSAIIIIRSFAFKKDIFSNPKYSDSLKIVIFEGIDSDKILPEIILMPKKYCCDKNSMNSFSELINVLDKSKDYDKLIVSLPVSNVSPIGLTSSITIINSPKDIFNHFYSCDVPLSDKNIEYVLSRCVSEGQTIIDYIDSKSNLIDYSSSPSVFELLMSTLDDDDWEINRWICSIKVDSGTYISSVLNKQPDPSNFLYEFVVNTALLLIDHKDSEIYSKERNDCLKKIDVGLYAPYISEFVSLTIDMSNAVSWLNCSTVDEDCEIIRRVSQLDLSNGVPNEYVRVYSKISLYLSDDYSYPSDYLNEYFHKYRIFKINNTVSKEFVELAYNSVVPSTIPSRNELLLEYSQMDNVALLVVDGLGAEYLPFLYLLFERMNYGVERFDVASVKLPSSTQFNTFFWKGARIDEIKGVDNTAHHGAIKNESTTVERNIYESLRVLSAELLPRISRNIHKFSKIIVTADHGTSRLAVLAHELKMSKTLVFEESIDLDDWRYLKEPDNISLSDDFERSYLLDIGTYWVVKGYNRLSKPGPKKYELHGGATLEERLVPFIVLSMSAKSIEIPVSEVSDVGVSKTDVQIVEKDIFKDL